MNNYVEEIRIVAENHEPISFEEAIKRGAQGKRLVFVSPTQELAESRFRAMREYVPNELIERVHSYRLYLKNDVEMWFLTDRGVEHGALRGMDRVVWVA